MSKSKNTGSAENLAFVMVGHIDHGKSTVIGRLLYDTGSLADGKMEEIEAAAREEGHEFEFGYVMDHLREERERGITIDTAQTFFSSDTRDYVIIDAPGHKLFIKNMITGASQAEAAVLICSVFEGVGEQTRRHAYVVKLLGLEQVLVLYNKMDLVGWSQDRFRQVRGEMNAFLTRLGVTPTLEVPVSAKLGDNIANRSENMPWYTGPTAVEALDRFRKLVEPVGKPLRFPVQDVYDVEGTVVVAGRIESGVLKPGAELRFQPSGRVLKVAEVRKYNEPNLAEAGAGECVGVVFGEEPPVRGEVACPATDRPNLTRRFRGTIFWMSPKPLNLREGDLKIQCATQEVPCRVASMDARIDSGSLEHLATADGVLSETEVGELTFETKQPVVLESFYDVQELGRFVLIRGHEVVAGGIVTHPEA